MPTGVAVANGEMTNVVKALQALRTSVDRATFDVEARGSAIGSDPAAAFAFVKDHIANELYPGVLRGAAGTLSAQAGNDLDKAVLLASLLAATRHEVRFARCTLSPAQASQRVAALFSTQPAAPREADLGPALKSALMAGGLSETRSAAIVAARSAYRDWLGNAALQTAKADLGILRAALDKADLKPSQAAAPMDAVEEARLHYWVQLKQGDAWQDLDAVLGQAPGRSVCDVTATYAELPGDAFQTLTITARNEYLEDGSLRRENVLSHQFRVADLAGKVLSFVNVGVTSGGLTATSRVERFVPFLRVDDLIVPGSEYALAPAASSGAFDMFGSALGGSEPPALAAQWLDFSMDAPGRHILVSRAVVDLVVPRERASGKPQTKPDTVLLSAQLGLPSAIAVSAGFIQPEAAIERAYRNLDAQAAGRLFDARDTSDRTQALRDDRTTVGDALLEADALAYAFAAERALAWLASTSGPDVRLVRDRPALTIANLHLRPGRDHKSVTAGMSIDLRYNAIRTMARSPDSAMDAFWASALHGLVDGAIEHHVGAAGAGASGDAQKVAQSFDSSLAIGLARSQGIDVRAAAGAAATKLLEVDLAEADGHRLLDEIHGDVAIIAPARPVTFGDEPRFGAWTVDLRTGHVVALVDTGLRQTATERAEANMRELEMLVKQCVESPARADQCRKMLNMWKRAADVYYDLAAGAPSPYPWPNSLFF
jgi:hypothetical protein